MPAISMFFGIIIRMYNNGKHNPPHFHASYQGYEAVFHRDELLANWELAINEQPLYKIEPLR
jgi:hypothetical protein